MQLTNIIRTISLIGAFALAVTTARAVTPAPDGGYPGENTAEGDDALFSLTSGTANTAVGFDALYFNTSGVQNTANGASALSQNTTGGENTAIGLNALTSNTTASNNTATGFDVLASNTTGQNNTANGANAVRYEAVNAMLLNEFLKEHRKVEELEATVAKLQSVVQKVSNQIELTKPAPRVVANQ